MKLRCGKIYDEKEIDIHIVLNLCCCVCSFVQQYACSYNVNGRGATARGVVTIKRGDEESLLAAVATVGPIATYVDAGHSAFQVYIYPSNNTQ